MEDGKTRSVIEGTIFDGIKLVLYVDSRKITIPLSFMAEAGYFLKIKDDIIGADVLIPTLSPTFR